MKGWTPSSWRSRPAAQQPYYSDPSALETVESCLVSAAPVTTIGRSRRLRRELAEVALGRAFLLQGGDCAETFAEFGVDKVRRSVDLLAAMADGLETGGCGRVVTVARMAGQFAKPRSLALETVGSVTLPAYRGDIVNGQHFDPAAREPDPLRMLDAHRQARATMDLVAAFAAAVPAGLSQARGEACAGRPPSRPFDLFISHEALLLNYEEALTRWDEEDERWWSVSSHLLWIGDRTRQVDGAHVEFARGLANPVAVKCGPTLGVDDLLRLAAVLDPGNEPGRLVLIGRYGAGEVGRCLPTLMRATRRAGVNALWAIDPMHGNTITLDGRKTRRVGDIVAEISAFLEIAAAEGVHPGGLHLEISGEDVTECIGNGLAAEHLSRRYRTHCDPRLNPDQAMDVARAAARLRAAALLPRSDAA